MSTSPKRRPRTASRAARGRNQRRQQTGRNRNVRKPREGARRSQGAKARATRAGASSARERMKAAGEGLRDRLRERQARRAEASAFLETRTDAPRREWPRRLGRVGLRLGAVMAVAWALLVAGREVYEYATTSARFEASHFIYEPTAHIDDETLRELLAIEPGTNILALDLVALSESVAAHPWVAEATVTRNLPDTLEVAVVEHEPEAIVLAERFYLVDSAGRPFKQVERGERGELPIITGIDRAELFDEDGRERAVEDIAEGLELLRQYQSKQRPRLGELHMGDDGSVTLYTAEAGTALVLGRGEYAARLERWDALRAALGERADRLAVVHLDHDSKPDRRDRVVARFASERDEALLLAAVERAEPDLEEPEDQHPAGIADEPERKPARAAGRRNRIPRYE
ncbi:FtsQ-type POTRA domain-containing protein [Pseudenhygromyxa sp. WMMC2535]|uniref:cell division protein FtsQ/DivIB n=1 Tax=Pseudenhygromyxa sp. WMMC2535 TaxID=2712867 RepID=UPI001557352C|nr:FtsQ-type POTRA domain-containing protein [Pseudenhygromyxa sp. WMMC2535]NVB40067.1 FtsQ-type POTRA domain-containing protein [Pseudenhygromyxa sp. WMMC2535]